MDRAAVLCYVGPMIAFLGLVFCFPNRGKSARWTGAVLSLAGVALATWGILSTFDSPVLPLAVIPLGVAAVLLAARMIAHANPVYSALYFGGVVLCTAALVLVLGAHFLAVILVIVYAGAILVAYVFVIMLAMQAMPQEYNIDVRQPVLALATGLGLVVAVTFALMHSASGAPHGPGAAIVSQGVPAASPTAAAEGSNVISLGSVLFGQYPVSLELAGIFLLIAMIGAIVLASMRINKQEQQSQGF
jgi:NADH-quinone oxidoreductase subunit J